MFHENKLSQMSEAKLEEMDVLVFSEMWMEDLKFLNRSNVVISIS